MPKPVTLEVTPAKLADAAKITELRNAAADDLTERFGAGHWSSLASRTTVARDIRTSRKHLRRILVARQGPKVVGTLTLVTKKPWAIDAGFFQPVRRPLYLIDMAITPEFQRRGVGRRMLEDAERVARSWPADAIRLDAYDAPAGAGPFYVKCKFHEVGRALYRATPHLYFERLL